MRLTLGDLLSVILGLAIVFTSYSAVSQTTDLQLNGIAIHSEFGKPQFMAALYSSSVNNNTESLSREAAIRMELKVLAPEGLPLRRFSRMWLEAISINSDAALLRAQADNMLLFDSLFKDRLQQKDSLVLNYQRGKGVAVSFNNITLGTIVDDIFFAMLLRTWIGSVPLSTDFKNAILAAGIVTVELKNRFEDMHPSAERSLATAQWLHSKPAAAIASSKKPGVNLAVKTAVQASAATPQALAKLPGKAEAAHSAVAVERHQTSITSPATVDAVQRLVARQLYISQLLKKIRANTRYPQRANERGQSDSLRIALAIDRQGNIISSSLVQESQYPQLNEAALAAIKKSTPLPPMPVTLTEPSFELTVPITFVSGKKQSALNSEHASQ